MVDPELFGVCGEPRSFVGTNPDPQALAARAAALTGVGQAHGVSGVRPRSR